MYNEVDIFIHVLEKLKNTPRNIVSHNVWFWLVGCSFYFVKIIVFCAI